MTGSSPRPTGALRSTCFSDLPILPYGHWRWTTAEGRLAGGPMFPSDAPTYVHMPVDRGLKWLRGPDAPPPGLDFERLPGRFVFVGPAVHHFGHMVAEFLHRLWVLREEPGLTPLLVRATRRPGVPSFVAQYLELIGAAPAAVVDRPVLVEKLVVGEPGRMLGAGCSAEYGRLVGSLLPPGVLDSPGQAPRLAILRGHIQTGRCIGEAWIEEALVRDGYRPFRPEEHTMAEQLAALAAAEQVVFSEGSAMHLLDLLPPIRARVAVLGRRPALHLIHDCLTEKVEKFVAFRPPFIIGSMAPEGARANALTYVDPTQVLRFLHAEGFLSNVPDEDYFALPGLLEADVAAYAQSWRRPPDVTEAFITEAIRSCREGRPSASAQATLANVAPRIVPA